MRKPLERAPLTAEELEALENLSRTTKELRRRSRAQIVLLAGEQRMRAPGIAKIVRQGDQTVRNWLKRWMAEGIEGLQDRPLPGPPPKIREAYQEQLLAVVRRRPRSLGHPSSRWTREPLVRLYGRANRHPCLLVIRFACGSKPGRWCSVAPSRKSVALIPSPWSKKDA